jgi:branched-chain amino acid transport system ATP-binding protein
MTHDPSPGDDALVVDGVTKMFHQLTAVDGVSFRLSRGEILGLIGPNGSGKSTLINMMSGVLQPTYGCITASGTAISQLAPHAVARAGVARTFQGVRLFGDLSVLENVMVAAMSVGVRRKAARRRAEELLAYFGLSAWVGSAANSLPYGHERIVEVARALAMNPKFLLLDEPAAGLDENESEALLQQLLELPRQRNLGLLIVDHDMALIMRLCQRIHVLNYGQSIADGKPEDIRRNPAVLEAYLGRGGEEAVHA